VAATTNQPPAVAGGRDRGRGRRRGQTAASADNPAGATRAGRRAAHAFDAVRRDRRERRARRSQRPDSRPPTPLDATTTAADELVAAPSLADAVVAADAAGLHYTPDVGPGIKRKRRGKGWRYERPDGRPVGQADIARINALAIPPAWTGVWINPDPKGHIQATGRDAKGRKQYKYHPDWRSTRDETKFGRAIAFAEALPRIRQRVRADLARAGVPREKALAAVVRLLERTLIRVGNAEYARSNESYGLTTLRDDHAAIRPGVVQFAFRGKSGKDHEIEVRDRALAGIVQKMQDLPGQHLFQFLDGDQPRPIGSQDVNDYLREAAGEGFTAKDFRTWAATVHAARALRAAGLAPTKKALTATTNRALDEVAARLGNTRAVCRAAYVHPVVLDGYASGGLLAFEPGACEIDGLDNDEWLALAWLRASQEASAPPEREPVAA
jgi:DNA topoisomerase-1